MVEVGMTGAGREDEVIVRELRAVQLYRPCFEVDTGHLAEQDIDVRVPAQHAPNWAGDLSGRQQRRRDLVEERLKHMIVLAVDDRDVDRLGGQRLGGRQSGEPRPDHHDAGLHA